MSLLYFRKYTGFLTREAEQVALGRAAEADQVTLGTAAED
jgi:hypothetical protein